MSTLTIALRGLALVAMLLLAWGQLDTRRKAHRVQREAALREGVVLRGSQHHVRLAASSLGEIGIRSWCVRGTGEWLLAVEPTSRRDAERRLSTFVPLG